MNNRKWNINKAIKPLLMCIITFLIILKIVIEAKNTLPVFEIKVAGEKIRLFEEDDKSYIFLPSFAKEEDIKADKGIWEKEPEIYASNNLPAIFISTASGNMEAVYESAHKKESGKIHIYNEDGSTDYFGSLKYIKGRGNYSWNNWEKKSFTINVGNSTGLLGLPAGGSFALIANASDNTLIRNELARQMESAISMESVSLGRFTDLYINGEYMGNYYLCPIISIGEERINIRNIEKEMDKLYSKSDYTGFPVYETPYMKGWNLKEEVSDYTGGYLIEREFEGRYRLEYETNPSGFETENGEFFVIKSPSYCSKKQINYIYDYVNEAEKAILAKDGVNKETGKSYKDYIDVKSFALWYLIGEVTKNYDAGVSSAYFYKDSELNGGKLKLASGWDYDMSMGNYLDWMEYSEEDGTGLTRLNAVMSSSNWYSALYDKEDFYEYAITAYREELREYMDYLIDEEIDKLKEKLASSAIMDGIRWKNMYERDGQLSGSDRAYEELKLFLRTRIEFLDKIWITE